MANISTFQMGTPQGDQQHAENQKRYQQHLDKVAASRKSHSNLFNTVRALSLGIVGGAGAAGALAGGAAAGGAASSVGPGALASGASAVPAAAALPAAAAAAPVATGAAGMSVPWWGVAGKGVDTLFGIYANKQNTKANQQALAYTERANAEAMAFEREQMAESKRQFDAQQAAAKAALDASNKFESDKWAASEEERLYNRRLQDEREARRAPYRAASAAALERLPGMLASGRTSPGLASLGSYRRT